MPLFLRSLTLLATTLPLAGAAAPPPDPVAWQFDTKG